MLQTGRPIRKVQRRGIVKVYQSTKKWDIQVGCVAAWLSSVLRDGLMDFDAHDYIELTGVHADMHALLWCRQCLTIFLHSIRKGCGIVANTRHA